MVIRKRERLNESMQKTDMQGRFTRSWRNCMNNSPNIDALRLRVKNAVKSGLVIQGMLTDTDGCVLYRGWLFHDKPYGIGVTYWQNGQKYQEGLFGFNGLLQGIEYYPNGNIRFWGNYRAHMRYGPNPPVLGEFYDEGFPRRCSVPSYQRSLSCGVPSKTRQRCCTSIYP